MNGTHKPFDRARSQATRRGVNASRLFRDANVSAKVEPTTLITDELRTCGKTTAFDYLHTAHIKEIRLTGRVHNKKIERMNGEVRDREETVWGLKRADSPIRDNPPSGSVAPEPPFRLW
jgi:hypothetical protein